MHQKNPQQNPGGAWNPALMVPHLPESHMKNRLGKWGDVLRMCKGYMGTNWKSYGNMLPTGFRMIYIDIIIYNIWYMKYDI